LDQRFREDLNLEYKRSWNQKALESVAAMANTYGGLILVGVPPDPRDAELPAAEPTGLDPAMREAIVNQCYMRLQPSYAPEALVVELGDPNRRFLSLGSIQTASTAPSFSMERSGSGSTRAMRRRLENCYIEFGGGAVGKVEANFLGGPAPTARLVGPSPELAAEKDAFGATRRERWFERAPPEETSTE
jgi:Schlafen, AlbA_2